MPCSQPVSLARLILAHLRSAVEAERKKGPARKSRLKVIGRASVVTSRVF
jgi:hypothetical protein